jgi:hypothetical protein
MDYLSSPAHPFYGIGKKLERADQNILNLETEISAFFNSCEYPTIPNPKDDKWQKAVDYHKNLVIPIRFGVLTGEIVHHLRSSLDHIVWIFSSKKARREHGSVIAFPILCHNPSSPREIERFERQIQGITDGRVRNRIVALQPYHRGCNAIDDPLAIVHQMDKTDKHRELVLIGSGVNFVLPSNVSPKLAEALSLHVQSKPLSMRQQAIIGDALKDYHDVTLTVLFPKFGKRQGQAVIPSLVQLINAVVRIVESFEIFSL